MTIQPRSTLAAAAGVTLFTILLSALLSKRITEWSEANPIFAAVLLAALLLLLVWGLLGPRYKPLLTVGGHHFTWGAPAMTIPDRDPTVISEELKDALQAALWLKRSDVEPQWILLEKRLHDTVYETDRAGTWKREVRGQPGAKHRLVVAPRTHAPPAQPLPPPGA